MLGRDGGLSSVRGCDRPPVRCPRDVPAPAAGPSASRSRSSLAGCAAATEPEPVGHRPAARPAPNLTPVPGGPSAPAAASAVTTDRRRTGFGHDLGRRPAELPEAAGRDPGETSRSPTSGLVRGSIIGDAATASATMTRALRAKGWTVDAGSPLEDGTIVLEATGAPTGCKAEIRFTPVSGQPHHGGAVRGELPLQLIAGRTDRRKSEPAIARAQHLTAVRHRWSRRSARAPCHGLSRRGAARRDADFTNRGPSRNGP